MPNVRKIWHFKLQNPLHLEMLLLIIANFFAIVLQCSSIFRIALQHNSKKNNICFFTYLTLSLVTFLFLISFLSPQRPLSLSLSLSLSHHISLSLMVGYSSVGHGSGVEVRLRMSRLAWYSGDFWVFWVQIGVFKLFPTWFAPWFPLNKCRQAELYLPWKCETKRRK